MRIPAFTADKDFGKITTNVQVDMPKQWEDRYAGLEATVDKMQQHIVALRHYVAANRRAIRRLMNVYTQHSPLFEVAEIYSIYDLARLNGNEQRSALAKMKRSEFWPQDEARQISQEDLKKTCEAAKTVTEDEE